MAIIYIGGTFIEKKNNTNNIIYKYYSISKIIQINISTTSINLYKNS